MTVAAYYLCCGHRTQTHRLGNVFFNTWVDIAVRAYRTRQLAHRHGEACGFHPATITINLQRPQRNLGAKRGGFSMNSVGATNHRCVSMGARLSHQHCNEFTQRSVDEFGCIAQHRTPCGIHHVTAGQPMVHPSCVGATDAFLHHINKRSHIVVSDRLTFAHGLNERRINLWRSCPTGNGSRTRRHPEHCLGVQGM